MAICLGFTGISGFAQSLDVPSLGTTFGRGVTEAAGDDQAIAEFYQAHAYAPLWTGADNARQRAALFAALDDAGAQGLPAPRYDAAGLRAAFAAVRSEHQRAKLEVRATKVFLTYARDVQTGFLTPSQIDSGIVRDVRHHATRDLLEAFAAADPAVFLRQLPPSVPEYAELQKTRYDLEAAVLQGGWGAKIEAKKLVPGDAGPAVVALRDRLTAQGYLNASVALSYDQDIQTAVQQFQADHGLTADGVAGEGTIAEVNRGPQDRLMSVLVAMERLRWMNGTPLGQRYIWVNLPDFTAKIFDDGKETFETVTVVGMNQEDRRSPEFSDQMEMMVVNPRWSVPRSITVKEYLPMLQRNPNAARQLKIVDRQGRVVDRNAVDFTQFTARNFPFSMSQDPSDDNALGLVKFLFPNQWNIYLHDTPSKPLFAKEVRAFSHGCIRVGRPFDLAYALLARQSSDPKALFQSYLDTRREAVVRLTQPVPVHIVYFTAWPDNRGHMTYRRDVYGRDARIFSAMQAAGVVLPGVQG